MRKHKHTVNLNRQDTIIFCGNKARIQHFPSTPKQETKLIGRNDKRGTEGQKENIR